MKTRPNGRKNKEEKNVGKRGKKRKGQNVKPKKNEQKDERERK